MIILKNGRIIDPANRIDQVGDIFIKNGRIEKTVLGRAKAKGPKEESGYKAIDVKGAVIAPGLIDMHVHLREPGFEYKEDIESGCNAAAAGGFTTVICMANTKPVNDNSSVTKFIIDKAKSIGKVNVFPVAALSKGMQGKELSEFGDLKEAGAVALSDDGFPVMDSRLFRRALEYAKDFGLTVIDHCEDINLRGNGVMNEGKISTRLGLEGIPSESESVMVMRDIELTRLSKGKLHLAHVSCEDSLTYVKMGKSEGLNLTCEATPHHFTLTEGAVAHYDTNTKMNPPLRSARDVQKIKEAMALGLIDVIASDHAPHASFEKNVEYDIAPFGIVGLETTLSLSLALVEQKVIDMSRLVELLSVNPSKILNLNRGTLTEGAVADLVVFDPAAKRTIEPDKFRSKSKNSPFGGFSVKGEVLYTLVGGKIVFDRSGEK